MNVITPSSSLFRGFIVSFAVGFIFGIYFAIRFF